MLVEIVFEELKLKIMIYKKGVPKLNKENFPTWKSCKKLHISGIGDTTCTSVENPYVYPIENLIAEKLKARKEHNQAMLEIASVVSYSKYEDVKGCANTTMMWEKVVTIYMEVIQMSIEPNPRA